MQLDTLQTTDIPAGKLQQLARAQPFRQFVKFCIVGSTSTAIQIGASWLLMRLREPFWVHRLALPEGLISTHISGHLRPTDHSLFYVWLATSIGFVIAVTNGFIWNRIWTFKGTHRRDPRAQYLLFFLVNIVGLCISSAIVLLVVRLLQGFVPSRAIAGIIGQLASTPVIVIWNFTANKRWTFAARGE